MQFCYKDGTCKSRSVTYSITYADHCYGVDFFVHFIVALSAPPLSDYSTLFLRSLELLRFDLFPGMHQNEIVCFSVHRQTSPLFREGQNQSPDRPKRNTSCESGRNPPHRRPHPRVAQCYRSDVTTSTLWSVSYPDSCCYCCLPMSTIIGFRPQPRQPMVTRMFKESRSIVGKGNHNISTVGAPRRGPVKRPIAHAQTKSTHVSSATCATSFSILWALRGRGQRSISGTSGKATHTPARTYPSHSLQVPYQ